MRTKNLFLLIIGILLLAAAGTAFAFRSVVRDVIAARMKPTLPVAVPFTPLATNTPATPLPEATSNPAPVVQPKAETKPVPKEANLAVPFTSQAPRGDWSMPYEETCEETSVLMVNAYLTGAGPFTPDTADAQILALVEWEKAHFGFYEDTTAAEVAEMARERFGFEKARAVKISSIKDVKAQIDRGLPVLLPAAGRQLFNPNFTGAGPKYHMLVVKGYTKDGKIITNDPGTRRGADYLYDPNVLWNAVHDWNGGDVDNGAKMMVIVEK